MSLPWENHALRKPSVAPRGGLCKSTRHQGHEGRCHGPSTPAQPTIGCCWVSDTSWCHMEQKNHQLNLPKFLSHRIMKNDKLLLLLFYPYPRIFFHYFFFLTERRERETPKWERNIDQLRPVHIPIQAPGLQLRYVPWPGIEPATFQLWDNSPTESHTR